MFHRDIPVNVPPPATDPHRAPMTMPADPTGQSTRPPIAQPPQVTMAVRAPLTSPSMSPGGRPAVEVKRCPHCGEILPV